MDDLVRQLQEELAHVRRERDGWMAQIGKVAALVPIPDVVKYTGTTGDLIRWLTSRVAAADEAAAALTEAQATIARLEEERAWRPIADDPPPYETRVLTWWPGNGLRNPVIHIDKRNSGQMLGKRDGWWASPPAEVPTHWQPLPDGPRTPDTGK